MKTEIASDWRRIVRAYLEACWSDRRADLESAYSDCEAQFLAKYGSESLWLEHYRAAKSRVNSLVPLASDESYEVIEESADRVLVQVAGRSDYRHSQFGLPYLDFRVRLIRVETGWEIAGLYTPCISCNFSPSIVEKFPGRCDYCRGSGTKYGITAHPRRFWPLGKFSAMKETCENCGGTGICPRCKEATDMPGWCQVFSVDGMKDAASMARYDE